MNFNMTKPCGNCPFKKVGAIDLAPGRLTSIAKGLIEDDNSHFLCHKTVYNSKTGGEQEETDDGEYIYKASGNESQCVGSMIYLLKARQPNVSMRLGFAFGMFKPEDLMKQADTIIEPIEDDEGDSN